MLALAGGNEFGARSRQPDMELLAMAGGSDSRVVIVPTAAVDNPRQAARNGVRYFASLGARAEAAMIVDRASAADPTLVAQLDTADLVYLTGGNPWHLLPALRGTPAHDALRRVHTRGKVVAGSSAGAMALAALMRQRDGGGWLEALDLARGVAVLVHADERGIDLVTIGSLRAGLSPGVVLLAIDTQTVLAGDGASWRNLGPGCVIVAPPSGPAMQYNAGDTVSWPLPP